MFLNKDFKEKVLAIVGKKLPKKIAVAVSGGLDSMALLVLLDELFGEKVMIYALTVDHAVRGNSAADAKFVENFCLQKNISSHILKSTFKTPPEVDIENSLRQMRYELLGEFCAKNNIKYLFLGHHQDDQAENFLIRLFRGSGIDGLAAINEISEFRKIKLVRPLLEFTKNDLKKYLQEKKISWVEDESNEDEKFLRNKIRKFLKSLPEPEVINGRIALASRSILEAKEILGKETKRNFPKIFKSHENSYLIDVAKFKKLGKTKATRYLGLALMEISGRIYKPRLKKLERIYQLIVSDSLKKEEFYGCVISRFSGKSADGCEVIVLCAKY